MRIVLGCCVVVVLSVVKIGAAGTELADAAMKRNGEAVRSLLQRKADVNAPQIDGSTGRYVWMTWKRRNCSSAPAQMCLRRTARVRHRCSSPR
jgi:hypothetical protein